MFVGLTGLPVGMLAGAVLAVAAGLARLGADVVGGPTFLLRLMPPLALVPVAVVEQSTVMLVTLTAAVPVYVTTRAAVGGADPRHLELARSVGLSRRSLLRRVILPGALPGFVTGMRFAIPVASLVLVICERRS
ncbi:ABC transporter permease subunit [Actinomadura fulvescens]|uniref:ABC transmembrane type-1 domain-containing protein n=1 Tax=Actinomadura fulvescens TaxID=46160 RepID=A0ABN3PCH6_9ACTN